MGPIGTDYLSNPRLNKGTAFTLEERRQLGLSGILPPVVSNMEQQVSRALTNVRRKDSDIDRYIFLAALQKRNERLYYRLLIEHIEELMPIVYTPTVGQACQEFASIFRETSGFYISLQHRGEIASLLQNWPEEDVRLIVVTDGERILGLGDLGTNGMGIPIGKLSLYCACAGVRPEQCMPIMLDVGTENEAFREDPMYLGLRQPRARGETYYEFVDEFIQAVKQRFPRALLQFEDFATLNAVSLLETYKDQLLCFNDDIQGTAAVVLAGIYAATRITNKKISQMNYLFCGAGSAATGIGDLLAEAMCREGCTQEQALKQLYYVDRQGLITENRESLPSHTRHFAKPMEDMDLLESIKRIKPDALIGATGSAGIFDEAIIREMAKHNDHPIIFALSNPTSRAECTAEQAYEWTEGRAIFASGSPFGAVHIDGSIRVPGQGNNAYVFPGLGLGAIYGGATRITNDMLITAANTLAESVSQNQIDYGCLYPSLKEIREVSIKIAVGVAETAYALGLNSGEVTEKFEAAIRSQVYSPAYD